MLYESFLKDNPRKGERCMEISNVSSKAVSVLIDYAYCIDVEDVLAKDTELAADVVMLACKTAVCDLRTIACNTAMRGMSVQNCPRLSKFAHIQHKATVFHFRVENAVEVSSKSPPSLKSFR